MQAVIHRTSFALAAGVVVLSLAALTAGGAAASGGWPRTPAAVAQTEPALDPCGPPGPAGRLVLDPTFGDGGVSLPELGDRFECPAAVALQPDGRIVVVGGANDGNGDRRISVARVLADGAADPSFGDGGVAAPAFTQERRSRARAAVVVQPDGRIVVAGRADAPEHAHVALARYLPDGTLDPEFGDGGRVRFDGLPFASAASAEALQPDGRLVVVGSIADEIIHEPFRESFLLVLRYLPDGTLDPEFGDGGVVRTNVAHRLSGAAAVALQADGKLVVAGKATNGRHDDFAVVRYLPDGTLDGRFGRDGRAVVDVGNSNNETSDVVLMPDGRIVLVGVTVVGYQSYLDQVRLPQMVYERTTLVGFTAAGVQDPTFGDSGVLSVGDAECRVSISRVAVETDGALYLTGSARVRSPQDPNRLPVLVFRVEPSVTGGQAPIMIAASSDPFDTPFVIASSVRDRETGAIVLAGYAIDASPRRLVLVRLLTGPSP